MSIIGLDEDAASHHIGTASDVMDGIDTPTSLLTGDWPARGIYGFNSRDARSRSFNLLRAQVINIMQKRGVRVIGITSAVPQVGKSFIACNLAAALSRIPDKRTLLFDLDLRRGSVAKNYGIKKGPGINTYLTGEIDTLGTVARHIHGNNLTIFPSFITEDSSAELLATDRMSKLLKAIYDLPDNVICICDLPPAFANDDASIILRDVGVYLLAVELGRSTPTEIREAIESLMPAECVGTILNRYHGGLGMDNYGFGYGGKAYGDYYQ